MARLLSLFVIFALVFGQGTAMASSLCRHESAAAHILAKQSRDRRVAAVSLGEEAAAAAESKKGPQPGNGGDHWPAELLPPESCAGPCLLERPALPRPAAHRALAGTSIPPLLKPPSI